MFFCKNDVSSHAKIDKHYSMGGIFGTIARENPCVTDLFYGTDYHSHLGTRRAGLATYSTEEGFFRSIHSLESSYFRTKFEPELCKFRGNSGIGVISDTDAQPLLMNSHLGRFAIVTVAKVNNQDAISADLLSKNLPLSEFSSGKINPTELVSLLIIQGKDFVEGIENVYRTVKGSCTMLLLTEDGIIAARDSWGRTPLAIGRKDGAYAIASETTAFANLGYEIDKFIGPGEIVRIKADGYEVIRKPNPKMQICSFLWIYYGFPTSVYEGKNVEEMRNETGRIMGREDKTEVDCSCSIPDSGIGMAIGYAEGHNVPYKNGFSKYTPTWPRSFMPINQETRNLVAKMKLIPNSAILKGKRVLFCDDSIVRGTQLTDSTKLLHSLGAREVHMRIACPPLLHSCPFINFSASKSELELITRRIIRDFEGDSGKNVSAYSKTDSPEYNRMVSEIASRLNLDSLKYSKIESIVSAIGLDKCRLCTHCFDGSSAFTLEEENV